MGNVKPCVIKADPLLQRPRFQPFPHTSSETTGPAFLWSELLERGEIYVEEILGRVPNASGPALPTATYAQARKGTVVGV